MVVELLQLDQQPCVVQYLSRLNLFLVGTYRLFTSLDDACLQSSPKENERSLEMHLETINNRAGKLILIQAGGCLPIRVVNEFGCVSGGGVFDAKTKFQPENSAYKVFVAHSNGMVGIYEIASKGEPSVIQISPLEQIKVLSSKMLTSIDIFAEANGSNSNRLPSISPEELFTPDLVVGDSIGCVFVISRNRDIVTANVSNGDSVWQVKCITLMSPSERHLIIVGAENCSWFVYELRHGPSEREVVGHDGAASIVSPDKSAATCPDLILLYKNSFMDFKAGVTCISTLDIVSLADYDLVKLLLGSYDETLQTYHVKLKRDKSSQPVVCHRRTLVVRNGGIWRVKPVCCSQDASISRQSGSESSASNKRGLVVAAMYAGTYLLPLDELDVPEASTSCDSTKAMGDEENANESAPFRSLFEMGNEPDLSEKPLHYDVDVSTDGCTFCVADFNNSMCLIKTVDR